MIKPITSERPVADEPRDTAHPGWWTTMAIVAVAWTGIPWALPIAAALPWLLFVRRHRDRADHLGPVVRWALATWITALAMLALAGARATQSIPLAVETGDAVRAWLDGSGGAVPSWMAMAAWTALFAVAAVVGRGIAATVVLANALLIAAVHAVVVFAHANNVFEAAAVAMPMWTVFQLAGMVLLLGPLCAWGEARVWKRSDGAGYSQRRLVIGAALLVAAFATRLLAGPLSDLARRVAGSS